MNLLIVNCLLSLAVVLLLPLTGTEAQEGGEYSPKSYDGHQVLRVLPTTHDHIAFLRSLETNPRYGGSQFSVDKAVDFWKPAVRLHSSVDIMVRPDASEALLRDLEQQNMTTQVLIQDVQKLLTQLNQVSSPLADQQQVQQQQEQLDQQLEQQQVDQQEQQTEQTQLLQEQDQQQQQQVTDDLTYRTKLSPDGNIIQIRQKQVPAQVPDSDNFFANYQTLENIHTYMDDMAKAYPNLVTTEVIGRSFERRPMKIWKIGAMSSMLRDGSTAKPVMFLDGGIHAREWVSPATVMFMGDQLVRQYGNDSKITEAMDTWDYHLLAVANPDGYRYSWMVVSIRSIFLVH